MGSGVYRRVYLATGRVAIILEDVKMKTLLAISAVAALALAGALPASAQTFEWGGGFTGQTMGGSAAWNLGTAHSSAVGGGYTTGGAGTTGLGGAVILPGFGAAAAGSLFSSGASGASSALSSSNTGILGGSTAGSATGGAMGSASGFLSYHP